MNMHKIPTNTIVFISGASGVGKTTIARKILEYIPEIIVIEEIDLIREAIRSNNKSIEAKLLNSKSNLTPQQIDAILNTNLINKSTSELSINEVKLQSELLLEPLIMICKRLQEKALPAIIEGVNLSFQQLLLSNYFDSSNMFFVNLYSSDEKRHKERIDTRCKKRNTKKIPVENFKRIRDVNDYLYEQTQNIINETSFNISLNHNIYNINTTTNIEGDVNAEIDNISKTIVEIIYNQFEKKLNI